MPSPVKETPGDKKSNVEETKPLALCCFFVRRYKLAFGLTLGTHIALLLLTGVLIGCGIDVIQLNFNGVPLTLLDHPTYTRALAWQNKDEDGVAIGKDTDAGSIGERSRTADNLLMYYQADQGTNVFTAERLREIKKVEDRLLAVPGYKNFCQLPPASAGGSSATCLKPLSVLRFFDGSYGLAFGDANFSDVAGTLYRASLIPQLNQILQFHLGKEGEVTASQTQSSVTRTLFYFGYPLTGHDLRADNRTRQLETIRAFQVNHFLDILQSTSDNGAGDMEFLFFSVQILTDSLLNQVVKDMLLAVGSFSFIFLFMLAMTGSLFLTSLGIFSIVSSFFIANLLYRFVFQYRYFGIFHVLSIFIILGVGSDNVFVFVDTWRATAHLSFSSLEVRLSACYRRAASATLFTSLTTMVAFFSNALSPLLAIQSFGLFSGLLVFVNYMSVILFFPAVMVTYHKHWETWGWPCFRRCARASSSQPAPEEERPHAIVRFFRGPFFLLLTHRVARALLLLLCLGLVVMFSVYAARIEPDEQNIQYYQNRHQYNRAQRLQNYGFKPSAQDAVIQVHVVWGLKPQDMAGCDKSDIHCTGRTVWEDTFDLNPQRGQSALLKFCSKIQNLTASEVDRLKIRRNSVTGQLETKCFIDRINAYMEKEPIKSQYLSGDDLLLPTSETKVNTLFMRNPAVFNQTTLSPLFYRGFETMMGYWLHDGYARHPGYYDYTAYSQLLGEGRDPFDTKPVASDPSYSWATKLVYAAVVVNTTLKAGTFSYFKGLPVVDAWDKLIEDESAAMPSTVSAMFQCTPNDDNPWHFLYVQKKLVDTAIQGIAGGISLAFVIITLATKNIVTGFLATLNICVVTVSVVGLIPMAGWKLGVLESLNLSLVVGLAVDYVVHLAEGYHSSPATDRLTRTRDMLDHVGISILSGALTTLGAAAFMFAAVILFFMQFGLFMFATIGFSLFYSIFGFCVLMGLWGPQGNRGSLVPLFHWLRFRLRGKRSHHVQCDRCQGKGFHPGSAETAPSAGVPSGTNSLSGRTCVALPVG